MSQNYRDAVEYAKKFLSPQFRGGKAEMVSVEPTEFVYVFGLNIQQDFDEDPWCGTHYIYPDGAFAYLFMQADTDKGAFDIASRIVTTKLLRGEPMSLEERIFSGQVLGGMRQCPPSEGTRRAGSFALNIHTLAITHVVAQKFGLSLTRNDETTSKDSACDAVSDALSALGLAKSPRAIKELLFHKSSERVREVAEAVRSYIHERQSNSEDATGARDGEL